MMEKPSDNLELTNDPDSRNETSLSNQERNSESTIVKESHDMHQRSSPDSGIHASHSNQERSSTSVIPDREFDGQNYRQDLHTGSAVSECNQEGSATSMIPKKVSNTSQQTPPGAGVPASEPDQESFIVALRPEKGLDKLPLRRNADSVSHASHSDQGITFSKLPEKPTGDGYNWRKYGQKLVKGNTFVRSYYKCTFANCPTRKQVERSHDGHITEINYLWKHEHPKPPHTLVKGSAFVLPVQSRGSDEPSLTTDHSSVHPAPSHDPEASETETHQLSVVPSNENYVEVGVAQSNEIKSEVNNDISSDSKRQKRENSSINEGVSTKTNCEPRVVVQTTSAVDIVNDGYRWRKYGQKLVKGNPNPRSYYRCSSAGCPAKKHVERASHDEKVVVTTYEGRHDHDMPAGGRTVTPNISGTGTGTGTTPIDNDGPRPQPEARESSGMEMVLHVSAT
nr:WRKY3647 [Atractylodes chinensis]